MKFQTFILLFVYLAANASPPALQLANIYHDDINLADYWVSEKYDGVRAYWDGDKLVSRQGNVFNAPDWFTAGLPQVELDGELWIARGTFDRLSGIVRQQLADDASWRDIKYMVFDLPGSRKDFSHRLEQLAEIIRQVNRPHVRLVKQLKIISQTLLFHKLDEVVAAGGEGLMLHRGSSTYKAFRSNDLLKLKKYSDAEARVIRHMPGKGKYQGMLGSVLVETADNKRFKIGSGFSDADRADPPPIGAWITFRYFGFTSKGTPRFASFIRVREDY